jgi:UDP-N-acetyl-D-mannosaminuronic acid dehydrogenase
MVSRNENQVVEENRSMKKVCVIGLGYIGLPTASMFAANGFQVIGVDINDKIISTLNNGGIHISEPGLKELVQNVIHSGCLRVSTSPEEADAFIIAVPTPFNPDKTADMRAVKSAAQAIVPYLREGNLVILESTSPPMTTMNLIKPILEQSGLHADEDFYLAYSPERVLPGQILRELVENARVIGGITPESAKMGKELYATFVKGEIVETDATTAEMVKLMENTYRDVNIAIANEFALISERMGINVWEAIEIANRHPRVNILKPGPGVGGHCIAIDPWFLVEAAPKEAKLIKQARLVNDGMPGFVIEKIDQITSHHFAEQDGFSKSLTKINIGCLGLTYKPDVDDTRESPAIDVIKSLIRKGYNVRYFDPFVKDFIIEGIKPTGTIDEVFRSIDILVILVNHKAFRSLEPQVVEPMRNKIILDCQNCLNYGVWRTVDIQIYNLGSNQLVNKGRVNQRV